MSSAVAQAARTEPAVLASDSLWRTDLTVCCMQPTPCIHTVFRIVNGELYHASLMWQVARYMYMITYLNILISRPTSHGDRLRSLISSLQHTHKVCYKERQTKSTTDPHCSPLQPRHAQAAT